MLMGKVDLCMNIQQCDVRKKTIQDIQRHLSDNIDGRVFIWGCSKTAETITNYMLHCGLKEISAYIVDDQYYENNKFLGRDVLKSSEWISQASDSDFVICGFVGQKQAKALKERLPQCVKCYSFLFPYSMNAYGNYLNQEIFESLMVDFEDVYDNLSDNRSKLILETYINACISGDDSIIASLCTEDQYFNDLTKDAAIHCFVDCGAYNGDTAETVEQVYQETIERIVCFEPDIHNVDEIKRKIEKNQLSGKKITIIQKGSWSEQNKLYFSSTGSSSSICEDGEYTIEVDSVDHVMQTLSMPVDYIKMDVEGSELETLQGSIKTIQTDHPICAICVYHKVDDIPVLFHELKRIVSDYPYRFYLRYHGFDLRELVLYAIPER